MDLYFCDECGTRVSDLDLRAGKGMRKRHDTICSGCVDQGLAGPWLVRAGQQASLPIAAGPVLASAAPAVAEPPDPISMARDRAQTVPDEPFCVEEPAAFTPPPKPNAETDAIHSKPAGVVAPIDGLAAAGDGFGALVGPSKPPTDLSDDPAEVDRGIDVADGQLAANAASPFDFDHHTGGRHSGKSETAEIARVDQDDGPVGGAVAKQGRSASGRQQSQKRSSTSSSKRNQAKPQSSRRSGPIASRPRNNKVVVFSLISCAVMLGVFTLVMLNRNPPRPAPEVIRDEPLTVLKDYIDKARRDSSAAMGSDDLVVIERAIASVRRMQGEFHTFESKAKNWDEDAHAEQLRQMGYYDVQSTLRDLNNRKVIVEQRGKP